MKSSPVKSEAKTSTTGKSAVYGKGISLSATRLARHKTDTNGTIKADKQTRSSIEADESTVKHEAKEDVPASPPRKRPGRPSNASKLTQATTAGSPEARPSRIRRQSPEILRESQPSPKLRIKLPRILLKPRHPDHITKPSPFSSLDELLVHFDQREKEQGAIDRDTNILDELDRRPVEKPKLAPQEQAWEEAQVRKRILAAGEPGGVLSKQRSSLYLPDDQDQPPAQYGYNDHLWAHGAYFRTLMNREKLKHMDMAKRTAYACLAKWKERQPQTEEEKKKEEDALFRLIYMQTVKDVKEKWAMVSGEIEKRRLAQYMEEQQLTRDLKMQQLLEDTTKMLDRRRLGADDTGSPMGDASDDGEDNEDMTDDEDEEDDDIGEAGSDDGQSDDDNMSSSESGQSETNSLADDAGDDNLSPEALRAKYAGLPEPEPDEVVSDVDDGADDEDTAMAEVPTEPRGLDISNVDLEEVDEALLDDEDDESTDMSDDMTTSDEEDSGEDDASDEVDESEEEDVGLFGFLGGRERRAVQVEDPVGQTAVHEPEHAEIKVTTDDVEPVEGNVMDVDEPAPDINHLTATSVEGDHSSQPTPMDESTSASLEAESTTTVDIEDAKSQIMPTAEETQPSRQITTKIPSLLRATLREYQHFGLDWLAKLYDNQTNGILADEMGLGKTIQTIALLAHLAEEHEVWGPHLIVVPTSVILNWEMEFKKFLPGFRVLSYYGTAEERKEKRKGWSNPDNFNVVITSYQLVLKDLASIKVPQWHYMILDEAHNIKNFQSQRYQAMIRLSLIHI